jgi:hypothetical protein
MKSIAPKGVIPRIYADTSVFGGVCDDIFSDASIRFFNKIRAGEFSLIISELVRKELEGAPTKVHSFFQELLPFAGIVDITKETLHLRDMYIASGILTARSLDDALHVATATIGKCQLIVSWNFKHIVHYQKIPLYNAVNILNGFQQINIFSPMEVIEYGNETI